MRALAYIRAIPVFLGITFAGFALLAQWVAVRLLPNGGGEHLALWVVTLYAAFVIPLLILALRAAGISISW